jgi:hypothetical protein
LELDSSLQKILDPPLHCDPKTTRIYVTDDIKKTDCPESLATFSLWSLLTASLTTSHLAVKHYFFSFSGAVDGKEKVSVTRKKHVISKPFYYQCHGCARIHVY